MSISQGQQSVRDYMSKLETLLGQLDSYDKRLMLNQFIWGLKPDLDQSISFYYSKSISQVVSLAETTELAMKASRRINWKGNTAGNLAKGQGGQGQRGGRRGGYFLGRGRSGSRDGFSGCRGSYRGCGYVPNRGRGGNRGRGASTAGSFDPQACYVYRK